MSTSQDSFNAAERRRAVRALLRCPLVTATRPRPEILPLVRRYERELSKWFSEVLGYRLVVEPDVARLYKAPPPHCAPRALHTSSKRPFSARHYALFCLLLAALERSESQTTLSQLAEQVRMQTLADDTLTVLDLDERTERRAFVEAVRAVAGLGCIELRDGDEEGYVRGDGNALYDVHQRHLAHVLSARIPPSVAPDPGALVPDTYPDTQEGRRRRIRHSLMRQLCEEAVLYYEDLTEEELAYIKSQRARIAGELEEWCGFVVEARAEGIACIDEEGDATDMTFPAPGTFGHGTLLLAEALAAERRQNGNGSVVGNERVGEIVEDLISRFGDYWRADVRDAERGSAHLKEESLERLSGLRLIERAPQGVVPRPAIARFAADVVVRAQKTEGQ